MSVYNLLEKKGITKYQLSKKTGIPYSTINDICSGKAQLEKCTAETIYRIAKELGVTMETLLTPYCEPRCDFELYKSNICHRVKEMGDVDFIIYTLETDEITELYQMERYPESLYLLGMLDYISRLNKVPICSKYDEIRRCRLKEPLYPTSIITAAVVANSDEIKEQSCREAIPEFMRFNIVESEIRNVV